MTLGEIRKGVASLPDGNRRRQLENWIQSTLKPWFGNRILPVTESIVDRWGIIAAEAKNRGAALPVVDGLLAATALENDVRNLRQSRRLGIA
jgi:predicted nucleic acid-binding protein